MNESEEGTVSSSEDECEEKSTQEGGTDEEEEGALPQLNIKGPGKVNIKHSQGVHIGSKINMEIKVGKVIVQSEGAIQQQPDRHAIAGPENSLQELVENAVARHLQNLLADKARVPLPIQSAESLMCELDDTTNSQSNQFYIVEEPLDENIVPCSPHQSDYQNNDDHNSEEYDEVTMEVKGNLALNQSAERSELIYNMAAPELNQLFTKCSAFHDCPQVKTQAVQTEENVQNVSQTEENVQDNSQTEENVLSVSQTNKVPLKGLILEDFFKALTFCISKHSLSVIELSDCGKLYNDDKNDPFGYKVDVSFQDGRLSDFSTVHLKSIKQFEITDNSVIMELALSFSKLEYSFNEFTVNWSMNLPRANVYTIKGNVSASIPDNCVTVKLVYMYNEIDNGRPLIKLVEDVHLERVQVNVTRYPDQEEHNRNDKAFLEFVKLYLNYEYVSNIKQSIVDTMNQAIDHLATSDNSFRQTIIQILDYLDDQDFPFT